MHADNTLPPWVSEAAQLPVAFAQVREDPFLDAQVVRRLGPAVPIIMIASGGCTLAFLAAACRLARIDVVDPNPAQIALARLKLHLLQNEECTDRLALLGHAPMPGNEREGRLLAALRAIDVPADMIGPPRVWAEEGPDHAGVTSASLPSCDRNWNHMRLRWRSCCLCATRPSRRVESRRRLP
jgi:S-adenosylmethionine-diacylglycerol 3-amino-3-carboxypropyl transferase